MIAEIIINSTSKNLNKIFDYIIPEKLIKEALVGSRVLVPFGKKNIKEGIILNTKTKSDYANKEILKIEDTIISKENIELAILMSKRYFCNVSDAIKQMLPPGNKTENISNRVKSKEAKFLIIKKTNKQIEKDVENKIIKSKKQIEILEILMKKDNNIEKNNRNNNNNNNNKNNDENFSIDELVNLKNVSRNVLKTLEKNGYIEIISKKVERDPLSNKNIEKDERLILNKEQKDAYNKINIDEYKEFLLFGITGSR